jgi:hypothetical protein
MRVFQPFDNVDWEANLRQAMGRRSSYQVDQEGKRSGLPTEDDQSHEGD